MPPDYTVLAASDADAAERFAEFEAVDPLPSVPASLLNSADVSDYADDPEAAALRCRCPDSPRYRAIGNAVTVSVVEWIGRRLPG